MSDEHLKPTPMRKRKPMKRRLPPPAPTPIQKDPLAVDRAVTSAIVSALLPQMQKFVGDVISAKSKEHLEAEYQRGLEAGKRMPSKCQVCGRVDMSGGARSICVTCIKAEVKVAEDCLICHEEKAVACERCYYVRMDEVREDEQSKCEKEWLPVMQAKLEESAKREVDAHVKGGAEGFKLGWERSEAALIAKLKSTEALNAGFDAYQNTETNRDMHPHDAALWSINAIIEAAIKKALEPEAKEVATPKNDTAVGTEGAPSPAKSGIEFCKECGTALGMKRDFESAEAKGDDIATSATESGSQTQEAKKSANPAQDDDDKYKIPITPDDFVRCPCGEIADLTMVDSATDPRNPKYRCGKCGTEFLEDWNSKKSQPGDPCDCRDCCGEFERGKDDKDETVILGHCLKCNQMTNHSYNRETGDYACLKCKSEKPRCCACGKTECEHQPQYIRGKIGGIDKTHSTFQKKVNFYKHKTGKLLDKLRKRKWEARLHHNIQELARRELGDARFREIIRIAWAQTASR